MSFTASETGRGCSCCRSCGVGRFKRVVLLSMTVARWRFGDIKAADDGDEVGEHSFLLRVIEVRHGSAEYACFGDHDAKHKKHVQVHQGDFRLAVASGTNACRVPQQAL